MSDINKSNTPNDNSSVSSDNKPISDQSSNSNPQNPQTYPGSNGYSYNANFQGGSSTNYPPQNIPGQNSPYQNPQNHPGAAPYNNVGYPPPGGLNYPPAYPPNFSSQTKSTSFWSKEPSDFTLLSLIADTFYFIVKQPKINLGITGISSIPLVISTIIQSLFPESLIHLIFDIIFGVFVLSSQGAIALAAINLDYDEEINIIDCFKKGAAKTLTFLLMGLLFYLLITFSFGIIIGIAVFIQQPLVISIILGIFFFFVWSILSLSIQACVAEDLGVLASFSRSSELTKGHRLVIMVFLILFNCTSVAIVFLLFQDFFLSFFSGNYEGVLETSHKFLFLANFVYFCLNLIFNAFLATAYKNARIELDGKHVDTYSNVFN
jgi:hypothetical protein